jgi:hypothetical protein
MPRDHKGGLKNGFGDTYCEEDINSNDDCFGRLEWHLDAKDKKEDQISWTDQSNKDQRLTGAVASARTAETV